MQGKAPFTMLGLTGAILSGKTETKTFLDEGFRCSLRCNKRFSLPRASAFHLGIQISPQSRLVRPSMTYLEHTIQSLNCASRDFCLTLCLLERLALFRLLSPYFVLMLIFDDDLLHSCSPVGCMGKSSSIFLAAIFAGVQQRHLMCILPLRGYSLS